MATLYFTGNEDGNWNNVNNWSTLSSPHTQASGLPSSSDSAVIVSSVTSNDGSAPTVTNLTVNSSQSFNISVTVSSSIVFASGSTFDSGQTYSATLTGNVTFNSAIAYGITTGNAILNGTSIMYGGVTNNVTCYDTSSYRGKGTSGPNIYPTGIVSCYDYSNTQTPLQGSSYTAHYYEYSYNYDFVSNATFNDNSYNNWTVLDNATFNDSSSNGVPYDPPSLNISIGRDGFPATSATFNDNSVNYNFAGYNSHKVVTLTFNNNSINLLEAWGNTVTMNHSSTNSGKLIAVGDPGTLIFNDNTYTPYSPSANPSVYSQAVQCYINGKPIVMSSIVSSIGSPHGYNNTVLIPGFTRAGLGVNGSNILGVL